MINYLRKYCLFISLTILSGFFYQTFSQDVRFIALGDLHYDRLDYHDWDYVMTRPQDFAQIMNEYPQYTAVFLPALMSLIMEQTLNAHPGVKAVVQLGDLVEGVAGTPALAREMNRGAVDMLYAASLPVPWVLVKGNHDVSNSPGQPEAWDEVIRPFIEGQLGKRVGEGMYSFKISGHTELFILDQFFSKDRNLPESEMVEWLSRELEQSEAKYKFVLTHQPVIPVTDRCWHLLSGLRRRVDDPELRNRFLNLLAKHNAIVLCAHLHRYAVACRVTDSGTVVQVMVNSVNRGFNIMPPATLQTLYKGGGFVDDNPDFQPATQNARRRILDNEKKFVNYFQSGDVPGYALITICEKDNTINLSYYNGFSLTPYQTINLTDLQKMKDDN